MDDTGKEIERTRWRHRRNLLLPPVLTLLVAFFLFVFAGSKYPVFDVTTWPVGTQIGEAAAAIGVPPGTSSTESVPDSQSLLPRFQTPTLHLLFIYTILLCTTASLILANTVAYLTEIFEAAEDSPIPANSDEGKNVRRIRKRCFYLALCTLPFIFIWLVLIVRGERPFYAYIYEAFAVFLFAVFALLDLSLRKHHEKERCVLIGKSDDRRAELECIRRDYFTKQLLYVDLPVVFGLLFVLFVINWLEHSQRTGDAYVTGFLCGATVMHLTASQLIFLFVSWQNVDLEHAHQTAELERQEKAVAPDSSVAMI